MYILFFPKFNFVDLLTLLQIWEKVLFSPITFSIFSRIFCRCWIKKELKFFEQPKNINFLHFEGLSNITYTRTFRFYLLTFNLFGTQMLNFFTLFINKARVPQSLNPYPNQRHINLPLYPHFTLMWSTTVIHTLIPLHLFY